MKGQAVRNGQAALFERAIPEKSIRAAIKYRMEQMGIVVSITDVSPVYVQHDGLPQFHSKVSEKGWPDLTGTLKPWGLSIYVETKAKGGRLSPTQTAMQAKLREAGAIVITAESVDDFETQLNRELAQRRSPQQVTSRFEPDSFGGPVEELRNRVLMKK